MEEPDITLAALMVAEGMIPHEEREFVYKGMQEFGGSFAKALSELMVVADPINLLKIKLTWPDIWQEYLEMGQLLAKKKEEQ